MTENPLDALRRAFAPATSSAGLGNYYPFYLMKNDEQAKIRFLPDKNSKNPRLFLVEKLDHRLEINGEIKSTPCLSQYGEDCPICAVAQRYYKTEGDDSPNGKKFYKKRKYIGQILVVEDPIPVREGEESHIGRVMYITIGFQIYNVMKSQIDRGFIDAFPYDYKNGYDFIIVKSQQGNYSTYALGSTFARQPTALDDKTIQMVEDNIVDLSTLIPANPGIEKTESLLQAALTGASYDESPADSPIPPRAPTQVYTAPAPTVRVPQEVIDEDVPWDKGNVNVAPQPQVEAKVETRVAPEPTPTPEAVADAAAGDEDAQDILAQIKARRKAKAS